MPASREVTCTVGTVELAASRVGFSSGKEFAVGVRRWNPGKEGERLREWRRYLEKRDARHTSLGAFLSRMRTIPQAWDGRDGDIFI